MFQSAAFQSFAFQTVGNVVADIVGAPSYSYHPEYHERKQEIKKQKTELQKVVSVIDEYQRREQLASESLKVASDKAQAKLLKIQNELITEINRLLVVKAEMMARIKRNEEQLILMVVLRRKRFGAFNLTEIRN